MRRSLHKVTWMEGSSFFGDVVSNPLEYIKALAKNPEAHSFAIDRKRLECNSLVNRRCYCRACVSE